MKRFWATGLFGFVMILSSSTMAVTPQHFKDLANAEFKQGYPTEDTAQKLLDELLFQRAVQSYLLMLPAVNMQAMYEGAVKNFGSGYNVMPIWKQRLNAKTLITTPNSDVIYGMAFLDLHKDGPMVIEAPPKLQAILDDFYQRPICGPTLESKTWCGDVGLVGPDKGKGGKFLILPPDYKGKIPAGYFVYKSSTYGVFVFWRSFFADPNHLEDAVNLQMQTHIYPLNKKDSAKKMEFPDASSKNIDMLFPSDGSYFEMLARFIDNEYVDPTDMDMRGMLAAIGIEKGKAFNPDSRTKEILNLAAQTAYKMSKVLATVSVPNLPAAKYGNSHWYNPLYRENPFFQADTYADLNQRIGYFTNAYSMAPAMVMNIPGKGAKYPASTKDAQGNYLSGENTYKLHVPANVPAENFWSVTLYDAKNASGLDNGQKFPSMNSMDKPVANADGSYDIYFAPKQIAEQKNWIRTVPGKGYFVDFRLYGPKEPFLNGTWKLSDIERISN